MFLSRVTITNFRNFRRLDLRLSQRAVLVGENGVGKSNLLHALRLVLDPTMSDAVRQLREDDFWHGLSDPCVSREAIEISIELDGFHSDTNALALLHAFMVQQEDGYPAKLTYRFAPISPVPDDRPLTIHDYEFTIFGGVDESRHIGHDVRRWLPLELLPALRDAAGDLSLWQRSPLRPLIERLQVEGATLSSVANEIDQATKALLAEPDVHKLSDAIESRLVQMVGHVLSISPSLGFTSTQAERLLRGLRLFGDGDEKRPVANLSLGVNNVLYLVLLAIELEAKETSDERATTVLAIEEPEAHLHPHLQRLLFRDFLRRDSPLLLTTHSPHIASVAPLTSIALLRSDPVTGTTEGRSLAATPFDPQQVADLERYLDATRAEILFARGVILVEGPSELFLVPAVAERLGYPLDEYGVSVCSVFGTDFEPYARLLGPDGLQIPFIVMTDADWSHVSEGPCAGLKRALAVSRTIRSGLSDAITSALDNSDWDSAYKLSAEAGVFVGGETLEVDFFNAGAGSAMKDVMSSLGASSAAISRIDSYISKPPPLAEPDSSQLLRDIERIGKGRFSQRFAGSVDLFHTPTYLKSGIATVIELLTK